MSIIKYIVDDKEAIAICHICHSTIHCCARIITDMNILTFRNRCQCGYQWNEYYTRIKPKKKK